MYVCMSARKKLEGNVGPRWQRIRKGAFVLKDDNAEVERQDEECACIRSRITIARFHRASNANGRVSRVLECHGFVPRESKKDPRM